MGERRVAKSRVALTYWSSRTPLNIPNVPRTITDIATTTNRFGFPKFDTCCLRDSVHGAREKSNTMNEPTKITKFNARKSNKL
jgi:hypothetical protein